MMHKLKYELLISVKYINSVTFGGKDRGNIIPERAL